MNYHLPIEETLKTAWSKVHGSKSTIWTAIIILIALTIGLGILDMIVKGIAPGVEPGFRFIMNLILYLLNLGMVYIGIKRAQDLPITSDQIFRAFSGSMILKVIGLYIVQTLILVIPVLLMIISIIPVAFISIPMGPLVSGLIFTIGLVSMIFLTVRILLSIGFVLDKEVGPIQAIKLSFKATESNFWNLVLILIIQSLIMFISAIPLLIGLIWTIPFALINYGLIYNRLASNNS